MQVAGELDRLYGYLRRPLVLFSLVLLLILLLLPRGHLTVAGEGDWLLRILRRPLVLFFSFYFYFYL